jgi:4-hydroxybenzoate polyprenyltransferase
MKLLGSFLRLIRLPNLAFIALAQLLFYHGVILRQRALNPHADYLLDEHLLSIIMLASFLIAAGGYVINDYFDINIDSINRPLTQVVERVIKRRWAMVWHIFLSVAGLILSMIVSKRLGNPLPAIFNLVAVVLLWFYSTDFKRKLLIGNVIISLLTSWVVLILYVAEAGFSLYTGNENQTAYVADIYKAGILFGGFAFISSLVREAVKDLEDMEGDARYNCRTMPIAWGVRSAKIYISVWLIVFVCALFSLSVYFVLHGRVVLPSFLMLTVTFPATYVLLKLEGAHTQRDYKRLSRLIKVFMLTGTCSMLLM